LYLQNNKTPVYWLAKTRIPANLKTTIDKHHQKGYNNYMQNKIQYLICKLQEEAAEVIQAVSKINRFGETSNHPDRTTTNKQELIGELEDFLAILAVLEQAQWLDLTPSRNNIAQKAQALMTG
jgi:phosphoribosyl-ATP pyrophosphohydrolase